MDVLEMCQRGLGHVPLTADKLAQQLTRLSDPAVPVYCEDAYGNRWGAYSISVFDNAIVLKEVVK